MKIRGWKLAAVRDDDEVVSSQERIIESFELQCLRTRL